MNKLKLIVLLLCSISSIMTHAIEEDISQGYEYKKFKKRSAALYFVHTMLTQQLRSQSSALASIDFVQISNSNKLQVLLNKLRTQQTALLAALSQNNDELLRALKDPFSPLNTQSLLVTSREILALSTDMDRYLNSKSV